MTIEINDVLSLFDGMSCGQIALNKRGVKYNNYLACEIDPYAIKIAQKNFPHYSVRRCERCYNYKF